MSRLPHRYQWSVARGTHVVTDADGVELATAASRNVAQIVVAILDDPRALVVALDARSLDLPANVSRVGRLRLLQALERLDWER